MTETIETEVREQLSSAIENFTMPRPFLGQSVLWYKTGFKKDMRPEIAFVVTIGKRNIEVRLANGIVKASVRHVEDPKLKLSEEQREGGAWEFTTEEQTVQSLKSRLDAVEQRLAKLENKREGNKA